ncbi:MAG: hypothetical protein GY796_33715 [Chloroflexi bacterium]|nr:hypothetical protein [Chloroflexota bacterium]
MFKKVLFVFVVIMMFAVNCAGNLAVDIADEFDGDFGTEIVDGLNLPEEVTVTKHVNGDIVYSERLDSDDFDNQNGHRFDNDESLDIEDVSNIDWHFDESGITFSLEGTNRDGDAVTISADLSEGNSSTVNIDVTD